MSVAEIDPATGAPPTAIPTIADVVPMLAAGRVSPVALMERCLARIGAHDGAIGAFHLVDAEAALAAARAAEREIAAGRWRGPLHGIPFAVKDNHDVAGLPTRGGSRLMDVVAEADSAPVALLRAAGAVLVGKLATWEYGTGNGGEYGDLPAPTTRNPWDTARFAGGSSTGAGAAVATGMTMLAVGSDTTGSVRFPAGACGVVGVRATMGRIPRAGLIPNCYAMDIPGPLAWTAVDAALATDALTGDTACADALTRGVRGMRIGVIREPGAAAPPDPAMVDAFEAGLAVLASLGATLVDAALPVAARTCQAATSLIGPAESAAIHEAELTETPHLMGFALRDKLLAGSMVRAADYIAALRLRRMVAESVDALLRAHDAVVTYGACHVAPRLDDQAAMIAFTAENAFTPFSLSGHPTLVQPTGFDPAGLPLHWQVAARYGAESDLFRVAAAFEDATPHRARRPLP